MQANQNTRKGQYNFLTRAMMAQYMNLHDAGYSNPDIAEVTHVSTSTVYRLLGEIARKNGVERSELLKYDRSPAIVIPGDWSHESRITREEIMKASDTLKEVIADATDLLASVDAVLK